MARTEPAEKVSRGRVVSGKVMANGTELYHEVRGSGPSLLFIAGALGDGSGWEKAADMLAEDFTVVSYDRRGNSRSPAPPGWKSTSMDEQADDAAALLRVLGLAPAAVYGNSGGGAIALNLVLRHPEVVRGGILHEPFLPWLLDNPTEAKAIIQSVVQRAVAERGMRAGVEAFIRFVAGDANYEALPPDRRERVLGNGETAFLIEPAMYENFHPDPKALEATKCPLKVLAGIEGAPFFAEMANRLAKSLRTEVVRMPGAHTPQTDHPAEVVQAIQAFFS